MRADGPILCGAVSRAALVAGGAMAWLAATSGCSLPAPVDGPRYSTMSVPARSDVAEAAASGEVHSDLIRRMLDQGQYYAALAHVQEQQRQRGAGNSLTWLEAEARRGLGEVARAEALYRELLDSDYEAQAHHGLGLLFAGTDLERAVGHLRQAVHRRPTDVDARNDLGYALMMAGRYREALPELATAVELAPGREKARNNLIILLVLSGDEAGVRRVVAEAGLDTAGLARLRRQAQSLAAGPAATRGGK